jgi:predicted RNase H-like nuclease
MRVRTLAFIALVSLAGSAFADTVVSITTTRTEFETHKAKLIKELDSDRYSEISPSDKNAVLKALDRIETRMQDVTSSDQLSEKDRVDVMNDQEVINTITTHAEADSRLICERSMATGTHRPATSCMTVVQRKARQKADQDQAQRFNKGSEGGGGG